MTNGTGKTTNALVSLSLMLSACGGGDGGGTASFTSWSSIQPSSTVVAQGLSQEVQEVDSTGRPSFVSTSSSATLTFDAGGHWSNLFLRTPATTVDLDLVGILPGGFLDATSTDFSSSAVIADPVQLGYEFQTFGVWATTSVAANTVTGAFSIGAPTPGSNIPTINGATFTGKLAGFYVDPDGFRFLAFGNVRIDANFASRTLAFSSSGTAIRPDFDTAPELRPDLELRGPTLSYAAGTNSFSGDVSTVGTSLGNMNGTTTGQFYGPSAQELGGVFFLQSSDTTTASTETYSGAYGAKQTP